MQEQVQMQRWRLRTSLFRVTVASSLGFTLRPVVPWKLCLARVPALNPHRSILTSHPCSLRRLGWTGGRLLLPVMALTQSQCARCLSLPTDRL